MLKLGVEFSMNVLHAVYCPMMFTLGYIFTDDYMYEIHNYGTLKLLLRKPNDITISQCYNHTQLLRIIE